MYQNGAIQQIAQNFDRSKIYGQILNKKCMRITGAQIT